MTTDPNSPSSDRGHRDPGLGEPTPDTVARLLALLDRFTDPQRAQGVPLWVLEVEQFAARVSIAPDVQSPSFVARRLALLVGRERLNKPNRARQEEVFRMLLLLAYQVDAALRRVGFDPEALR